MNKQIKRKVLTVILSTSLGAMLLSSITWVGSIFAFRNTIEQMNETFWETAVSKSHTALVGQVQEHLATLAQAKAKLTDERLSAMKIQTETIADVAGQMYTYRTQYRPQNIERLRLNPNQTAILPLKDDVYLPFFGNMQNKFIAPHVRTAPGVQPEDIWNEVSLAANITDSLNRVASIDGIAASYIGGASGYFIAVDKHNGGFHDADSSALEFDIINQDWYKSALEKDALVWNVIPDEDTKNIRIFCTMPFYDQSSKERIFKGVAGCGSVLRENFDYILDSTRIGKAGYTFLLNEKGQVILSPYHLSINFDDEGNIVWDDYLHSGDPEVRNLAERMTAGERFVMDNVILNGNPVYVACHPLSMINWSVGVVTPVDEVIAPSRQIQKEIVSLIGVRMKDMNTHILRVFLFVIIDIIGAISITIFMAKKLSDSLTEPIITLSKDATTICEGNLHHRIDIKTGDELEALSDTFNQMIENITYISSEKERIGTQLRIATKIQASMLPCTFPPFPERKEFDIYAEMHTAKEVGGDFYDFFFITEDHLAVVIADVSGKGVPAALFMVIAKTLIKDHALMGKSLDAVFYTVNNHLCENNRMGMFVTAFMGILEIPTGKFKYVNAGHNPPLVRRGGEFTWLETKPGLVLAALENIRFQVMETTLAERDMVFLYTDGVTEAMNQAGELFSNQRLLETLNRNISASNSVNEYIGTMLQAIRAFADGAEQVDDITMLVLERK
jgi:sigma-B regulation protein RsbU (phosphoserine phosphatase)